MSTAPKPPTPQGISALLRKAGHTRAEIYNGGLNTEGYRVTRHKLDSKVVLVNWWADSGSVANDRPRHDAMLREYAEVISDAGFDAQIRLDQLRRPFHILVRAKED